MEINGVFKIIFDVTFPIQYFFVKAYIYKSSETLVEISLMFFVLRESRLNRIHLQCGMQRDNQRILPVKDFRVFLFDKSVLWSVLFT